MKTKSFSREKSLSKMILFKHGSDQPETRYSFIQKDRRGLLTGVKYLIEHAKTQPNLKVAIVYHNNSGRSGEEIARVLPGGKIITK